MRAFYYLFLFISFQLFAQEKFKFTYNCYNDTEIPNFLDVYLFVDLSNDMAIFKENFTTIKQAKDEINGKKMILIKPKKNIDTYLLKSKNEIRELKLLGNNYVNVVDSIVGQNWQITDEVKVIDGYNVTKAICYFRGRNWEAWFCKDLPFYYGPWKFSGLPGLIIQISDEKKRYNYNLTKIEYEYDDVVLNEINEILNRDIQSFSLVNFAEYENEFRENTRNIIFEGRSTSKGKKVQRNGIELKYEWEE